MTPDPPEVRIGAWRIALAGLVALAVAMGIGRFAFTPILPAMQADAGISIARAGWLAASNYLGYFVGALFAAGIGAVWAIRGGLLLIAVATFAMGMTHDFPLWLVLRCVAGLASALVLIHISAWALAHLAQRQRADINGVVYAGVGVGIAVAGGVCMVLMAAGVSSAGMWAGFGVLSLVCSALVWRAFDAPRAGADEHPRPARARRDVAPRWNADRIRLAACYGAFGFGYIVPATFLPAMAHRYITNPLVFGWAWPVFGVSAAVSTWAVSHWLGAANNRRVWAGAYLVMAVGVALPVVWPGLPGVIVSALCVGGTFMVATMLGLKEARRVAAADATFLIAALTAAFAFTQVVGPLVVSALARIPHSFSATLLAASAILCAGAWALWRSAREAPVPARST